jgi:hypothetical protein
VRAEGAPVAGGDTSDLGSGKEKLPTTETGAGHARDAPLTPSHTERHVTRIGLLGPGEHRLHRACESDRPAWESSARPSHVGHGKAAPHLAFAARMVARVLALRAPACRAPGGARTATRTRRPTAGAAVPPADESSGREKNHSKMDDGRSAQVSAPAGSVFNVMRDPEGRSSSAQGEWQLK